MTLIKTTFVVDLHHYNNEGSEYKIQRRVWSAALGRPWGWIEENPREAEALYLEYMNGDIDRIIFYDAMSMTLADIKAISQRYNTRLIIIDQLDNVASPKGEANHDMLKIRALYQRSKGRDLFDLFEVSKIGADWGNIVSSFKKLKIGASQKDFINNLEEKMKDQDFITDMIPLLPAGTKYDINEAYEWFQSEIVSRMD